MNRTKIENSDYWRIFEELLKEFGTQVKDKNKEYCIFEPQIGSEYKKDNTGFMLCGRAPNGWESEKHSYKGIGLMTQFNKIVDRLKTREQDMNWITDHLKSRFFTIARDTLFELNELTNYENWSNYMVWTNLMKIAPATAGNPTYKEWELQKEQCITLFKMEIEILKPQVLLLITGADWAYDFLEGLGLHPEISTIDSSFLYIKGLYEYLGTRIIVTDRPERKLQEPFVAEIKATLDMPL